MFTEVSKYFIFLLLSIFLIYSIGSLLYQSFVSNNSKDPAAGFKKLAYGILIIVVPISLIVSGLKTINLLILIPLGLIFYFNRQNIQFQNPQKNIDFKLEFYELIKLFGLAIPIYIIACVTFFKMDIFPYQMQHHDFFAYSKHSQAIMFSGNENYYRESNLLFPNEFGGLSPYHFFEIWLNGFIVTIFSLSSIKAFLLITFPVLQLTCLTGLIVLIQSLIKQQLSIILLAFIGIVLLYVEPLYFSFYNQSELLKYYQGICNTSILSFGRKYAPILIYAILFLIFYLNNNKKTALIFLASMPILSIGLLPGIGLGVCLYSFYIFLRHKKKEYLFYIIYSISFSLLILLFFKFNAVTTTSTLIENNTFISIVLTEGLNVTLIKQFIFKALFPFMRVVFFIIPYFILITILLKTSKNKLKEEETNFIILTVCILISGVIGSAIAFNLPDSGQLLYNILPFLNLLVIYLLVKTLQKFNLKIAVFIIFIFSAYNALNNFNYINLMNNSYESRNKYNFSSDFKTKCLDFLNDKEKRPVIGYLYKDSVIKINPHQELYKSPGIFLEYSKQDPILVCLNNPKNLSSEGFSNIYKTMWPLYVFQDKNPDASYGDLIKKFTSNFGMKYLLVEGKNLPADLQASSTILFYDTESDYGFYEVN